MGNKITEEQRREQEEAARRAEEARRAAILSQISARQSEVSLLTSKKTALVNYKTNLTNSIQKWTDAKNRFEEDNVAKNVVVKDIFEGSTAETVQKKNANRITKMDAKMTKAVSVKDGITTQVSAVTGRINTLNYEISGLRSQL